MKKISHINIKRIFFVALLLTGLTAFVSCKDEFDVKGSPNNNGKEGEQVFLPITISFASNKTRAEGDIIHGNDIEHQIDFDVENECYAIFFDEKKRVKYIKPLLTDEELGSGASPAPSGNEYSVTVKVNVPRSDVDKGFHTKEENNNVEDPDWSPLAYVMVVLNGGAIYNELQGTVNSLVEANKVKKPAYDDIAEIGKETWYNPAKYSSKDPNINEDMFPGNPPIGFNYAGHFTMTNSAYWGNIEIPDKEDKAEGDSSDTGTSSGSVQGSNDSKKEVKTVLMTASPITGDFFKSMEEYKKNGSEPSVLVYVERMVSRFSPPTFGTEVIGSDRVFRPDQYSLAMKFHRWEGDKLIIETKNWRIHLLSWTINGYESSNYIFKQIGNFNPSEGFEWWNDQAQHRSYWSIDPHYNSDVGYYPWQVRKAADMDKTISIDYALTLDEKNQPTLRYKTFNQVKKESGYEDNPWNDKDIYMHENTYNPEDSWDLDGHPETLAGSHLLVLADIYIEGEDGDYKVGDVPYGTVTDLYGDSNHKYYLEEKDWFKSFVNDINNQMRTQEKMGFNVLDWDKEQKNIEHYTVWTPGDCKLFYDGELLTNDLIDKMYEENAKRAVAAGKEESEGRYLFTNAKASVRNGDGRLIPWVEGGLIDKDNPKGLEIRAPRITDNGETVYSDEPLEYFMEKDRQYKNEKGETITRKDEDMPPYKDWSQQLYKSLFFEWFGPIDHYKNGYMYYSGAIQHRKIADKKPFYGIVRNHWYRFNIESINAPGIPVDDPDQLIIPEKHAYRNEIAVYLEVLDWHPKDTEVEFDF